MIISDFLDSLHFVLSTLKYIWWSWLQLTLELSDNSGRCLAQVMEYQWVPFDICMVPIALRSSFVYLEYYSHCNWNVHCHNQHSLAPCTRAKPSTSISMQKNQQNSFWFNDFISQNHRSWSNSYHFLNWKLFVTLHTKFINWFERRNRQTRNELKSHSTKRIYIKEIFEKTNLLSFSNTTKINVSQLIKKWKNANVLFSYEKER